jgi:hypothetical protein
MAEQYENFDQANDVGAPPATPPETDENLAEDAPKQDEVSVETKGEDDAKSWQSKADKAEARANKAEREIDALRRAQSVESGAGEAISRTSANGEDPWLSASKDNFRNDLFGSDGRLASLGFSPDLIQGSTPAEMRKSLVSLQGTVDRMQSGIRNQVLIENGLEPVPGSGERATGINFKTMPQDEFNKLVDKQLQS